MNGLKISTTISSLVLALVLFFSGYVIYSEAQAIPGGGFGGRILLAQPVCVSPVGSLVNIGLPKGGQFMYLAGGSYSYSAGPPRTPGQQMLGKTGPAVVPCMIPCPAGVCPHPQGGGLPILFHGSSLI